MRNISCLLGTAIGDALGCPFECVKYNDPILLNWDRNSYISNPNHKFLKNHKPGDVTDDTIASEIIIKSLIDNNGYDPEIVSKKYVDWIFDTSKIGSGGTMLQAATNIKNGISYKESGVRDSYGSGSAMRSACFGVYFSNDFFKMKECVITDSNITHGSNCARDGALAVAITSYYLTNDQNISSHELIGLLINNLSEGDIKDNLTLMIKCFDLNTDFKKELKLAKNIKSKFDVRYIVPFAINCFIRSNSFKESIVEAINDGNDADTTSAIAGALAGIKYGIDGIPKNLIENLNEYEKYIALDDKVNEYLGR